MITQNELKKLLEYREDGHLYWKKSGTGRKINIPAGVHDKNKYHRIQINNKRYYEHHLVWLYHYGGFQTDEIDHINQIKNDNYIDNLRNVIRSYNRYNSKTSKNASSQYMGVSFVKDRKKWASCIRVNGKNKYLGLFKNEIDAAKRRDEEIMKVGCQYCTLNIKKEKNK